MHAITIPQDPEVLREKTLEIAKIYLAAGIDPKKSAIFIQSHVKEHAELMWILNTLTKNGDLNKMTQFKDKTGLDFEFFEKQLRELGDRKLKDFIRTDQLEKLFLLQDKEAAIDAVYKTATHAAADVYKKFIIERFNSPGVGLFDYPVLMAADILLYDTEVVPVGEDQLQHVELTRTLAKRFNSKFGETFVVPESHITKESMRIMGLDDPSKKMSKSATSEYNYIGLLDDAETVKKKIKKAVTDSGNEIVYSDDKPALKNLINIYSAFSEKTSKEIEKMYAGRGYADFKNDLSEEIIKFLEPFQKKFKDFSNEEVLKILEEGAEKARPLAEKKIKEVKEKIGFIM